MTLSWIISLDLPYTKLTLPLGYTARFYDLSLVHINRYNLSKNQAVKRDSTEVWSKTHNNFFFRKPVFLVVDVYGIAVYFVVS